MSLDPASLDRRMTRLEKQNRYLKLALGSVLALALMGTTSPPGAARASSFILTDPAGLVRAELTVRDGTAGLFIKDEEGRDRLVAVHDSTETGLFIKDEAGSSRVGVAQYAHGGGGVALHGAETKGAAVLYFKNEGSLRFFDTEGNVTKLVKASPSE